MADFIIKSAAGTGNKTLIQGQDQSGSNYAIEIGDAGASIIKPSSIKTVSNTYDAIKFAELNSRGVTKHNFFGASYYLSTTQTIANATWEEIGSNGGEGRWTKMVTRGVAGADDSDVFGVFNGTTGRFTPTIPGYYMCGYNIIIDNVLDDGEYFQAMVRINGSSTAGENAGRSNTYSPATNAEPGVSGICILPLDTDDYLSLFLSHAEGGTQEIYTNNSTICFAYMGGSDL